MTAFSSERSTLSKAGERIHWWEGIVYDPMPIGGIAGALMLGTGALLGIPLSIPLLLAGVCGTALVYGLDRGVVPSPEDVVNHPERRQWMKAHIGWLRIEATALFLVGSSAFFFLNVRTQLGAGLLAGVAGLHLLSVGRGGRLLKSFGFAKPLVVAGTWAVGGTLLPVLEAGHPIGAVEGALAGYRFMFILPNVLLSDWGDRAGDAAAGLQPWAEDGMGDRLRWGSTLLLVGAAGGALFVSSKSSIPHLLAVDVVGLLLMVWAVWTLQPTRPGHRLVLDGIVAWPLVTALVAWLGG